MTNSDIVQCQFLFSGIAATDNFICSDRFSSGTFNPPLDTVRDTTDVVTTRSYDDPNKLATLTATFYRKLDTLDVNQDFILRDGDTLDAIWAWGMIASGNPGYHGYSSTMKDSFRMKLYALKGASPLLTLGWSSLLTLAVLTSALM